MMSETVWRTSITQIKPNEVRLRGYRIDELMGRTSFSDAIYLAILGELPSKNVSRMIEAILVSSIDHGATPPSALAARTAASTGAPLNAAVACGLLSINRHHGGAIEDCVAMLDSALNSEDRTTSALADVADELLASYQQQKKRIPGLGHRLHTEDPRTEKLFALAEELGLAGKAVGLLLALQAVLAAKGKPLPINVDGAIGAILFDLGVPSALANAFFFIARLPGLVAQVYEEQSREKPMRRIHPTAHEYDGTDPRSLDD
jgi:citrate synthase